MHSSSIFFSFSDVLMESLFAHHFQILPGQKIPLLSAFIFYLWSHTFLFHRNVFFTFLLAYPLSSLTFPMFSCPRLPTFQQSLWFLSPPVQARIIYLGQHLDSCHSAVIFYLLSDKLIYGKNEHRHGEGWLSASNTRKRW